MSILMKWGALLAIFLTAIFVTLKLIGVVGWPWSWVVSPLPLLAVGSIFLLYVVTVVGTLAETWPWEYPR